MAMTRLQVRQAVSVYVQRTDAGTIANELRAMELAQEFLARVFYARESLLTVTVTMTTGSGPLPADFCMADTVSTVQGALDYESPREFVARGARGSTDKAFTIIGQTLRCDPKITSVTLLYHAKPAALTADGSTNWLSTFYEDVLVWAAVAEQHRFLQDWAQADAAMAYAMQLMGESSGAGKRGESSGGRMKMRSNP